MEITGQGRARNHRKQCTYYHKLNTVEECYSKHGYLSWMKQRNKYAINNLEAYVNNQSVTEENDLQYNQDKNNQNNVPIPFTNEQIQLQRVLKISKNKMNQINTACDSSVPQNEKGKNFDFWILDTGVTNHVTHEKCFC